MNSNNLSQPLPTEWPEFMESLNAEFFSAKGYGVYAYLTFNDIKQVYDQFLTNTVPAKVFIKIFVRNFK